MIHHIHDRLNELREPLHALYVHQAQMFDSLGIAPPPDKDRSNQQVRETSVLLAMDDTVTTLHEMIIHLIVRQRTLNDVLFSKPPATGPLAAGQMASSEMQERMKHAYDEDHSASFQRGGVNVKHSY